MFQIVYIPIATHGYFYAVSTANNTAEDNVSKVYQIAKLLQVFPLPVRVCSIYPQKINGEQHNMCTGDRIESFFPRFQNLYLLTYCKKSQYKKLRNTKFIKRIRIRLLQSLTCKRAESD